MGNYIKSINFIEWINKISNEAGDYIYNENSLKETHVIIRSNQEKLINKLSNILQILWSKTLENKFLVQKVENDEWGREFITNNKCVLDQRYTGFCQCVIYEIFNTIINTPDKSDILFEKLKHVDFNILKKFANNFIPILLTNAKFVATTLDKESLETIEKGLNSNIGKLITFIGAFANRDLCEIFLNRIHDKDIRLKTPNLQELEKNNKGRYYIFNENFWNRSLSIYKKVKEYQSEQKKTGNKAALDNLLDSKSELEEGIFQEATHKQPLKLRLTIKNWYNIKQEWINRISKEYNEKRINKISK